MRRAALIIAWLVTDLLLFIGSYALAYFLRVGWIFSSAFPLKPYLLVVLLVTPAWLVVLLTTRCFSLTRRQCSTRSAAYILFSSIVGASLFAMTYYFLYGLFFSRMLLLESLGISTMLIFLWHVLFEQIQRSILAVKPVTYPTLIVGLTREASALIAQLTHTRHPLQPVAILDGRGAKEKEVHGVPVLGKLDKLEQTLRDHRITHLIHCSDLEQSLNLLSACRSHGITYLLLPSVLGIMGGQERVDTLEGHPVTVVSPKRKWWETFF